MTGLVGGVGCGELRPTAGNLLTTELTPSTDGVDPFDGLAYYLGCSVAVIPAIAYDPALVTLDEQKRALTRDGYRSQK